jgi:hypothetical protein
MISLEFPLSFLTPFSTFLTNVSSSSSFSPPPETSRRVLPVTLQTVAYALYRFLLGHWTIHYFLLWDTCLYFLLLIEVGICNVSLRLVKRALLFPSGLLHCLSSSWLLFTSTQRLLIYQKKNQVIIFFKVLKSNAFWDSQ